MIELRNLTFCYTEEKPIIKEVNLEIKNNQKISVIGQSGCGKTTLLLLISGLVKAKLGEIKINGELLENVRKDTGIIFQNEGLFPWKTVYGNLSLGLKARKIKKSIIENKINNVLKELSITQLKNKYIKELSGGERQRVAIARTLVLDSDVLLFDEPSSSLDAFTKENFQNLMMNIYRQHQLTSIIVTHDIEEAVYLGEKIIIMRDGIIEEIIDNESLFGEKDVKNTISFYERCIEIRKKLGENK